jgi:hypothetical protein
LPDVQSADPATVPPPVDALLRGRVVDEAGQPSAGASALVQHRTGEANLFGVVFLSAFTLGLPLLSCLAEPPNICDDEVTDPVPVASDGAYEAVLPAAHVPGYEADTDWVFVATAPAAPGQRVGPTSAYEFEVAAPIQEAPDLVLWEPQASTTSSDGQAVIGWRPLAQDRFDDGELQYAVTVLDQDGAPILEVTTANDGVAIDARLLEDAQTTSTLTAYGDRTAGPTIYHQTMSAPGPDLTGAGPAPSRGANCVVVVDGTAVPVAPCPVTDGALSTAGLGGAVPACVASSPIPQPFEPEVIPVPTVVVPVPTFDTVPLTFPEPSPNPPPSTAATSSTTTPPTTTASDPFPPLPSDKSARQQPGACPTTAEVVIALDELTSVDLVVARGCPTCAISRSTDGVTFDAMGDDPARQVSLVGAAVVAPAAPQPATHVRIQAPPEQLRLLTEVSVWPSASGTEPAEPLVAAPGAPTDDSDRPVAPIVGAVLLIVATATGLAACWRRPLA